MILWAECGDKGIQRTVIAPNHIVAGNLLLVADAKVERANTYLMVLDPKPYVGWDYVKVLNSNLEVDYVYRYWLMKWTNVVAVCETEFYTGIGSSARRAVRRGVSIVVEHVVPE